MRSGRRLTGQITECPNRIMHMNVIYFQNIYHNNTALVQIQRLTDTRPPPPASVSTKSMLGGGAGGSGHEEEAATDDGASSYSTSSLPSSSLAFSPLK